MSTSIDDIKMKLLFRDDMLWYTEVLYGLEVELGESLYGTAHTDGLSITVDPKFWGELTDDNKLWLLVHELRHVTDMHQMRRGTRDPILWNQAGDHVINLDLKAMGLLQPNYDWILCDSAYANMSVEDVYEILINKEDNDDENKMPDIPDGSGEDNPDQSPEGSVADQIKDLIIQATLSAKKAEASSGKRIGNIPADILRQVEEWTNPVLHWTAILRKYMSARAKNAQTWKRPNRRLQAQRLYTPTRYSKEMGVINVFIDASCSVSDDRFSMQYGQLKWIHTNLKPKELRVIIFNTRIVSTHVFKPHEKLDVDLTGRGGTSVSEVVKYMEENPSEVNLIFTDGYFSLPSLANVKSDIIAMIYDNKNFEWEQTKVLYVD